MAVTSSLLFVALFSQLSSSSLLMEADVAGGHSAVAAFAARQPRKSISSAVAEGVSCKGQAGTTEPKVAKGIPRRGPSPKRTPREDTASVPAWLPVEEPNFKDAAAKGATVLAAAPRPTRAAAPHGSSAVAGVATTSVVEGEAARKKSEKKFCKQYGSNASAVAEERAMSDVENDRSSECDSDDNCGDGTAVYEEDLHTSEVADDDESLDLGRENKKRRGPKRGDHKSRVTRSRVHHSQVWCEFCQKGSHATHGCRWLINIWQGLKRKIPWDEFLYRLKTGSGDDVSADKGHLAGLFLFVRDSSCGTT